VHQLAVVKEKKEKPETLHLHPWPVLVICFSSPVWLSKEARV